MTDYFSYNTGKDILGPEIFRVSPSQLSRFFDDTHNWYREFVLGETPIFTNSTSTCLGTCVHAAAAMYHDTKSVDTSAIDDFIASLPADIDHATISDQYRPMTNALVNGFLARNKATHSEAFLSTEIIPGFVVAGSIDWYNQHTRTLVDFKTMGSLDSARVPSSFPRAYYFQQLAYAYLLRKNGLPVDFCKLVYVSRENVGRISEKTGKPLQDYPSTVNIITHQITDDDMILIENALKLIAESVAAFRQYPELRHLFAQDYRLKLPPSRKLFKD